MYQLSVYIHILSAVVWVGGMLFIALVLVPATRSLPAGQRAALVGAVGRRFRVVGWVCIALLLLTGTANAAFRGVRLEAVLSGQLAATPFGRILLAKLGLVALMLVLSALHDFVLGPASTRLLERGDPAALKQAPRLRRQASWVARLNALLALLVLLLAVGLVRSLPF